jgi:glycerol-3-phosphate acyltransferase PlsY
VTEYILSAFIGYLFGSFPTAYLLVKWRRKTDIRQAGSGNVGTMNVLETTGSTALGVSVLVIDMAKGAIPVILVLNFIDVRFESLAAAGLGAIVGHSFSAWLGFKGGRGLATTAGALLVIGWIFIIMWIALWVVVYLPTKNIHAGNILASILSPPVVAVVPREALTAVLPQHTAQMDLVVFGILLCTLIIVTHRDQITTFFQRHTES